MGGHGRNLSENWIPHFLSEQGLRIYLQNLYVAIVGSNENARNLTNQPLNEIRIDLCSGNPLSRRCYRNSIKWLRLVKEFSLDDELFNNQILEPARAACRAKYRMGESSPFTLNTKAVVFRKSKPYYDLNFGGNIVTISVILPELHSIQSLRCRVADAEL